VGAEPTGGLIYKSIVTSTGGRATLKPIPRRYGAIATTRYVDLDFLASGGIFSAFFVDLPRKIEYHSRHASMAC
jgi:hypothetical protein